MLEDLNIYALNLLQMKRKEKILKPTPSLQHLRWPSMDAKMWVNSYVCFITSFV
jgi:hypothetical protein